MIHRVIARDEQYYKPIRYKHIKDTPGFVKVDPPRRPATGNARTPPAVNYSVPEITAVFPPKLRPLPPGHRQWLIIEGKNFPPNARLEFTIQGGRTFKNRIPHRFKPHELQYRINVGNAENTWEVRVVTPRGQRSAPYLFAVTADAPQTRPIPDPGIKTPSLVPRITAIIPNRLPPLPSGQHQPITFRGQNFTPDARLEFTIVGGPVFENRKPRFVSANELQYNINVGPHENTWEVRVVSQGRKSAPLRFSVAESAAVSQPGAVIKSITPRRLQPLPPGEGQWITIRGENFTPDATLELKMSGGRRYKGKKPQFVSSKELRYQVNVGPIETSWDVQVVIKGRKSKPYRFMVLKSRQ